jgi:hypothetical protein
MADVHRVVALALGMLVPAGPALAASPIIAVFAIEDARPDRLSAPTIQSMTDYLASQLASEGRFRVVPSADLKRALASEKSESYKACYDEACQIEIGKELAAQKSLSTKISRLGSQCIVTSILYDLAASTTETSAVHKGGCKEDDLVAGIETVAKRLRGDRAQDRARETVATRAPPEGAIANPDNGHYYFSSETAMSWWNAKAYCEKKGAQLASVTSRGENSFIHSRFARARAVWLGATDEARDGVWTWVSGEAFEYANWFQGLGPHVGKGANYLMMGTVEDGALPNGAFFRFGDKWISDRDASGVLYGVLTVRAVCEWVP